MTEDMTCVPFLDLAALHKPLKRAMLDVLEQSLESSGFIGGPNVSGFETEFAAFCCVSECIGVGSGTDALRFALMALGVGPGDTVITIPNTFIATTEAISQTGAKFEFVDIDPATSLMDMNALETRLQRAPTPKAVVPVHLYGQCVDMRALMALSKQYGFYVVEDACQAHGATHHGQLAGSMGHMGCFSFYPGKNLGACGEAGAITTNDSQLAQTTRMLRDHGQAKKYEHRLEGYNGRLDAVQAGLLRVKLPFLAQWNEERRAISDRYDQAFAGVDAIRPAAIMPGNVPARHIYAIHTSHRDALSAHLSARNIQWGLHYPIPLHLQECYRHLDFSPSRFPNAEKAAAELLSLPLFPGMTTAQVDRVVAAVLDFGAGA